MKPGPQIPASPAPEDRDRPVRLRLRLLGTLSLVYGDRELPVATKKNRALLAILALSPRLQATRARLCGLLWGDRGEEQARSSLRQSLAVLRKELGDAEPLVLRTWDDMVGLAGENLEIDVVAFLGVSAAMDAASLRRGVVLYRGEALADTLVAEAGFEDWLAGERRRLADHAVSLLDALCAAETGAAKVEAAKRLVALDPLREASHRALMRAYAETGEVALALQQFDACRALFKAEFGVEPAAETAALRREIAAATSERPSVAPKSPSGIGEKPSIAVLPFANRSGDPAQDFFSDGITEDIITDLSNVSGLFVLGRNIVFTYKGKAVNPTQIAQELGVSFVVEGSVRQAGGKVRISAQLIDGATGGHLWAARYDRDLTDVFTVQDEITRTVVEQLKVKLLPEEIKAIARVATESVEAYTFYLRGREFLHLRTRSSYRVARQMFARAIELDPLYARAYAGLAVCDAKLYSKFGVATSVDAILATADRAIDIDPKLAEAHAARGFALKTQGRRAEALAVFGRALALDPGCFEAHEFLAEFHFQDGDFEQAAALYLRMMEIQPSDYRSPFALQMIYQSLGREAEAEKYARIGLARAEAEIRLHPDSNLPLELGAPALASLGERDRAIEWITRALEIDPDDNITRYNAACTYALLGEAERALDVLEQWIRLAGADEILWFKNDPDFEPLKQEARYQRLIQGVEETA